MLLKIICVLAQDEWESVYSPCRAWLGKCHLLLADSCVSQQSASDGDLTGASVLRLALQMLADSHSALQKGEDVGTMHARTLVTLLQVGAYAGCYSCCCFNEQCTVLLFGKLHGHWE